MDRHSVKRRLKREGRKCRQFDSDTIDSSARKSTTSKSFRETFIKHIDCEQSLPFFFFFFFVLIIRRVVALDRVAAIFGFGEANDSQTFRGRSLMYHLRIGESGKGEVKTTAPEATPLNTPRWRLDDRTRCLQCSKNMGRGLSVYTDLCYFLKF